MSIKHICDWCNNEDQEISVTPIKVELLKNVPVVLHLCKTCQDKRLVIYIGISPDGSVNAQPDIIGIPEIPEENPE